MPLPCSWQLSSFSLQNHLIEPSVLCLLAGFASRPTEAGMETPSQLCREGSQGFPAKGRGALWWWQEPDGGFPKLVVLSGISPPSAGLQS